MNIDDLAVVQATSVNCKTLADDTLRISFDVLPKDAKIAFSLFGQRGIHAAIAALSKEANIKDELFEAEKTTESISEEKQAPKTDQSKKGEWGKLAASLYRSGFLFAPKVVETLGTDKEFRRWINRQPSAFSGDFSEWTEDGEGRCIAAHVRRSDNAGTGYKPPYSCIPLTDKEHQLQHREGESALVGLDWDAQKIHYLIEWARSRLYEIFKVDSLTKINPEQMVNWCSENDLMVFLPRVYKLAYKELNEKCISE